MLEIEDVLEYIFKENAVAHVDENKKMNKKNYVGAVEILRSKYLQRVGIIKDEYDKIEIQALCIQVTKVAAKPHCIDLSIVRPSNSRQNIEFSGKCSCVGGSVGKCKHFIALLLWLTK
jgi:hypothetical protein